MAAVLPRETNCEKMKALSISSEIKSDRIAILIHNNSLCKYQGFLTVQVVDASSSKSKLGPFIRLYTFEPKSTETYVIEKIGPDDVKANELKAGLKYYLVAYIEENNNGEVGVEFTRAVKEFVYARP